MSDQIKISMCITTRNRADLIGETLASIISQAGDNIEIVIVDGASTDNTAEVVRGFKQKFISPPQGDLGGIEKIYYLNNRVIKNEDNIDKYRFWKCSCC